MKKILLLTIGFMLIMIFTGCGKAEKNEAKAFVPNPWVDSTNEEIENALGKGFVVPSDATNVIFRYSASMEMAEMRFVENGIEWNARMQKTSEFTDISGLYYTWTETRESIITDDKGKDVKGEINLADSESGYVFSGLWYHKKSGLMLSLSAVSENDINSLFPMVFFEGR